MNMCDGNFLLLLVEFRHGSMGLKTTRWFDGESPVCSTSCTKNSSKIAGMDRHGSNVEYQYQWTYTIRCCNETLMGFSSSQQWLYPYSEWGASWSYQEFPKPVIDNPFPMSCSEISSCKHAHECISFYIYIYMYTILPTSVCHTTYYFILYIYIYAYIYKIYVSLHTYT